MCLVLKITPVKLGNVVLNKKIGPLRKQLNGIPPLKRVLSFAKKHLSHSRADDGKVHSQPHVSWLYKNIAAFLKTSLPSS